MEQELRDKIADRFDYLFSVELLEELAHVGQTRRVKEGKLIMEPGQTIEYMPFLLEGSIKVMREEKDGQELLLYYLEAGDTCAMTLSCCMGAKRSKIKAVAEEDTLLLMVPVRYLEGWVCKYPEWKAYIFDSVRVRLDEFIETIDSLAFMRMDERLLKYLRDRVRVTGKTTLETTHHEIAVDLNSSRVVISRLMKQLENQNIVRQHRNLIELLSL
jgi:CRP/FNR family transcriptional regulator